MNTLFPIMLFFILAGALAAGGLYIWPGVDVMSPVTIYVLLAVMSAGAGAAVNLILFGIPK